MGENPNSAFSNPNYSGIGNSDNDGIDTVTDLHILDESERLYQATKESLTDPLTGCYNRRFLEKFKEEQFDPNRDHNKVGFVVVDLNNLKRVNDEYGHAAGDELLQYTAGFLKSSTRKRDVVVRTGGDEFVVVCHNDDNINDFEATICERMNGLLSIKSPEGFAYGCAVFDRDRDPDFNSTQRIADDRMYEHKRRYRNEE